MSDGINLKFLDQPSQPTSGNTSTLKVDKSELKLSWKDGEIVSIDHPSNSAEKLHVEKMIPDAQGSIIKSCWECYLDDVSGGWYCLKVACTPKVLEQ